MKDKQKETAVALKYEADEDIAPRIIAKGQGVTAENIVKSAKEHDIPVYQDENWRISYILWKSMITYRRSCMRRLHRSWSL